MEQAPKIELKNIKYSGFASEETHCYQASLYIDGEKWGLVGNDGHGGPDYFHGDNGRTYSDIDRLNKALAELPPFQLEGSEITLPQDLELICGGLVNEYLREKDFARAIKSKILFTKPDAQGVYQIAVKKPFTFEQTLEAVRANYPQYTLLADMPKDQAKAVYFAQ